MKIGLCLAGGGIKGAAHIGALKAFEEANIQFDYISGASSGSIVATLYACGYTADEIYILFKKYAKKIKYVEWKNILKLIAGLIFKRQIVIDGLNSGNTIEKIMEKACLERNIYNIKEVPKNLIISSVDLDDGTVYIFSSMPKRETRQNYSNKVKYIQDAPIAKAVRASCSFPRSFFSM